MKAITFLIILLATLDSTIAWGFNLQLDMKEPLKVEEMYVEYRKYEAYRNTYYPPEKDDWTHTGEFHYTVSVLNRLYWQNNFHMSMDSTPQVRHGGWEYYMGLRIFKSFHLVKYHHSEHVFEDKFNRKFPVEDSYGVRVYFKTLDNRPRP